MQDLLVGLMLLGTMVFFGTHILQVAGKAFRNGDMESVGRCVIAAIITLFIFAGAFKAYAWALETKMEKASSDIFTTPNNHWHWDGEK